MHERTNSAADRSELETVAANRNSPQKHVWRAKIVLLTADGHGTPDIMRATGKAVRRNRLDRSKMTNSTLARGRSLFPSDRLPLRELAILQVALSRVTLGSHRDGEKLIGLLCAAAARRTVRVAIVINGGTPWAKYQDRPSPKQNGSHD